MMWLVFLVAAFVAIVEVRHHVIFGHFAPYGLHADVTVALADIGIPGISKVYQAQITNFGIIPRRVERCEFITDDSAHGVAIGYRLEKRDNLTGRWQTVVDAAERYCQPYPLGIMKAHLTSRLLWPGQVLSTADEATGARGNLKGETMRFIVQVNGLGFETTGFTIDEQIQSKDVGYRVRH
jgi:hypothetical protein